MALNNELEVQERPITATGEERTRRATEGLQRIGFTDSGDTTWKRVQRPGIDWCVILTNSTRLEIIT